MELIGGDDVARPFRRPPNRVVKPVLDTNAVVTVSQAGGATGVGSDKIALNQEISRVGV